jgi:magnesium transporter
MTSLPTFPAETAPRAQVSAQAADGRALLARSPAAGPDLPVCHGDRLVGVVPVERLVAARDEAPLASLMDEPTVVVAPVAELADAAWQAAVHGARSVAVVDQEGRFLHMVPPQRLIGVLSEEHAEDLARLGGFLSRTGSARLASEESVRRRLWHRLPWLALGLLGAMLSAGIVASFEEQLERVVLLAFFVPAVVYMADAVGTQTETVVIRGMALGVSLRTIVARELATGVVIGVLLAAAFFAFAFAGWGEARVAAVVSIALFVSAAVATVIAMLLPYLLDALGRDPAYGSGPLATVIQDLLSILVYFLLATALL